MEAGQRTLHGWRKAGGARRGSGASPPTASDGNGAERGGDRSSRRGRVAAGEGGGVVLFGKKAGRMGIERKKVDGAGGG